MRLVIEDSSKDGKGNYAELHLVRPPKGEQSYIARTKDGTVVATFVNVGGQIRLK